MIRGYWNLLLVPIEIFVVGCHDQGTFKVPQQGIGWVFGGNWLTSKS